MRGPAGQKRPPGAASLLTSSSAGISTNRAGLLVAAKIDSLYKSCQRVRVEGHEAVPWSGLLDDFSALSASLRLLRDSLPASFSALSVVPHQTPTDFPTVARIPDLLLAHPGERSVKVLDELDAEMKRGGGSSSLPVYSQDLQQLRITTQSFNRQIEKAREELHRAGAECKASLAQEAKVKTITQPLRPRLAMQRKNYETLHEMLTQLNRGTGQCPPPLTEV